MVMAVITAAFKVLGFQATCHGKQRSFMDDLGGLSRMLCWAQENKMLAVCGLEIKYLSQADLD